MSDYNREFEEWKANNAAHLEHYKAQTLFGVESFKSLHSAAIAFAINALKLLTLVNGAAALAILAFLGHLASKDSAISSQLLVQMIYPMSLFAFGTAAAVLASGGAYLSQIVFAETPRADDGSQESRPAEILRVATVLIAFGALGCFVLGVLESGDAFTSISALSNPTIKS